jgi:hypothetical protein
LDPQVRRGIGLARLNAVGGKDRRGYFLLDFVSWQGIMSDVRSFLSGANSGELAVPTEPESGEMPGGDRDRQVLNLSFHKSLGLPV